MFKSSHSLPLCTVFCHVTTYEVAVVACADGCSAGWCIVILVIFVSLLIIVILFSLLCHTNKLYCLFINGHKAH